MNYGLRKGYFDIDGQLTASGSTLAKVLGVFGKADSAELRVMLAEGKTLDFAKAA
jgi:hypothetical protein